jgi:hypothetical protein
MRKSIVSRFAAALVLSALVPLAAMAQDAAAPAATKTPATTSKVTAPNRNMRKITSRYMMGNRPVATRGTSWRNRQFHRGMPYGRTQAVNRTTRGNMAAGNTVTANHAAAKGVVTAPTNSGMATKKAGGSHHKHPTSKQKATQTSSRHVARHSGKSTRLFHLTNLSNRR